MTNATSMSCYLGPAATLIVRVHRTEENRLTADAFHYGSVIVDGCEIAVALEEQGENPSGDVTVITAPTLTVMRPANVRVNRSHVSASLRLDQGSLVLSLRTNETPTA